MVGMPDLALPDMTGKTVVMTGATSGIGEIAARRLAGAGARIIAIARDAERAARLLAALPPPVGPTHRAEIADLSSMAETAAAGRAIAMAEPRIDVLVNNAGAVFSQRQVTPEGLERTFALNHMACFILTATLGERLAASTPARIVTTASAAHRRAWLDPDDLQSLRRFSGFAAYSRSKLCNILFTRELARRLGGTGITANCLHPGFVASRFGDGAGGWLQGVLELAKWAVAISPERGAEPIIELATNPEFAGTSGAYLSRNRRARPSRQARDETLARRLWDESARLARTVGVDPDDGLSLRDARR